MKQRTRRSALTLLSIVLLAGCDVTVGSIPGVFTTGDIRITGFEPDLRACVLSEGTWLALLGENFGSEEAWASGENTATFPPNPPGIEADPVQLVGSALFLRVPDGASSGTLVLDAGASGTAEIPITIESGSPGSLRLVGTVCTSNPPPVP